MSDDAYWLRIVMHVDRMTTKGYDLRVNALVIEAQYDEDALASGRRTKVCTGKMDLMPE